jgi:hypothetical protein
MGIWAEEAGRRSPKVVAGRVGSRWRTVCAAQTDVYVTARGARRSEGNGMTGGYFVVGGCQVGAEKWGVEPSKVKAYSNISRVPSDMGSWRISSRVT